MKVLLQLPHVSEARIGINEKAREIGVEPVFVTGKTSRSLLHVTVSGDSGKERLFVVTINGRTGNLSVSELVPASCVFDGLTSEAKEPSE